MPIIIIWHGIIFRRENKFEDPTFGAPHTSVKDIPHLFLFVITKTGLVILDSCCGS